MQRSKMIKLGEMSLADGMAHGAWWGEASCAWWAMGWEVMIALAREQ